MIEAQQPQNANSTVNVHAQSYMHPTTIQIRLDTQMILRNFEMYLRGSRSVIVTDDQGVPKTETQEFGEALANDIGIQALMNRIQMILNAAVVQGNYPESFYRHEISQIRMSIATSMMQNLVKWDIKEDNYREIVDTVMTPIKAFLSRLKDNKERDSYSNTLQSVERTTVEGAGRKGFGLFNRGH